MITAQIVADSRNPIGKRITSYLLKYPRFIHSELMTHRMLSRNAASSRAIPVKRMIQAVRDDPAMPEWWGATQQGMKAKAEVDNIPEVADAWFNGRLAATALSQDLFDLGLHKQIANRVMEPWSHILVLVTATDFDNFFSLRAHPDAQPEFQVLAYRMLDLYLKYTPVDLHWSDWHLPFGDQMPAGLSEQDQIKVATARAARLSYVTLDTGEINVPKDLEFHDWLAEAGHWSPFEHPAQADENVTRSGNFSEGWRQYRKDFQTENRKDVDLEAVMAAKPDWIKIDDHSSPVTAS